MMNKLKLMVKRDSVLIVLFSQIMLLPAIFMRTGSDCRQKKFSLDLQLNRFYCI
jgi:hypothetical protein